MSTYEVDCVVMLPITKTVIVDANNIDEAERFAAETVLNDEQEADSVEVAFVREIVKKGE